MSNTNPFSTCFTKPGAIPFRFVDETVIESLVTKLIQLDWIGQILGPHGSGKSTLIKSLIPLICRQCHLVVIHQQDSKREVYLELKEKIAESNSQHLIVIDGFEQLSSWRRSRLIHACKRRQVGLLVTAHQSVGLPVLYEMPISLSLFRAVVDQLLTGAEIRLTPGTIGKAYQRFQPNLREALFSLYDEYERVRTESKP